MTQIIKGQLPVDTNINNIIESLATCNKGETTPQYAQPGMLWLDDSNAPFILKMYDGQDWIVIGELDTTAKTFTTISGTSYEIATTDEATAGTDDTKIMTPLKVKQAMKASVTSNLINVVAFDASGTYTKSSDATRIAVYLYGAGGAGGSQVEDGLDGEDTLFGVSMSALGGPGGIRGGVSYDGVSHGDATGGDVNLTGGGSSGGKGALWYQGNGLNTVASDGANGGFAFKLFDAADLPATVEITIGQGGEPVTSGSSWVGSKGVDGLCMIYEYA